MSELTVGEFFGLMGICLAWFYGAGIFIRLCIQADEIRHKVTYSAGTLVLVGLPLVLGIRAIDAPPIRYSKHPSDWTIEELIIEAREHGLTLKPKEEAPSD